MYRCQKCQQVTAPGTKAHKLVVEKRARHYPSHIKPQWVDAPIFKPFMWTKPGHGWEIIRELTVCPACAEVSRPTSGFP